MAQQLRLSRRVRPKKGDGFDGFRERIRHLCELAGSQRALAAQCGVSQPVISNWVAGDVPKADMLARFAEKGRFSAEWLLFGRGSPQSDVSRGRQSLAADIGAHFRSRLAAVGAGCSDLPDRSLADTVDGWLSDEQLGTVALQRLEELLPGELLEIERWVTRRLEAADLLADLARHSRTLSPRLATRLLRSFDELLQQPSGATALDTVIRNVVGAPTLPSSVADDAQKKARHLKGSSQPRRGKTGLR